MDKVRITSEFDRTADFILYEGECLICFLGFLMGLSSWSSP